MTPILGGSWQAFDNLFGDNNCCINGDEYQYQGPFGTTDTSVGEATSNWTASGRITDISTSPAPPPWTTSQAQSMVQMFMPPDAQLKGSKPVYFSGTNLLIGVEKTYMSALLARSLPAADFKHANGSLAQPGVIYVYMPYDSLFTSQFDSCTLGTDESIVLPQEAL